MKSLFSSSIAILTGLLILTWSFILAETFTEGIRVSSETASLEPGQYVWEPERAPEGPLLIVASVTEQVAYVYRNGVKIGRAGIPNLQVTLPLKDLVFTALQETNADGHLQWAEVTATGETKSSESIFLAAQKSGLSAAFLDKAKTIITPGVTLIFTDRSVDPSTQSPSNFQILVAQKDKPTGT